MANITINEISSNYSFNIGTASYACVAMPITSCWGPYLDLSEHEDGESIDDILERTTWNRFPATQEGLESFVAMYRGSSSCWRLAKDYSYQMAMTLMSAGYDVLVCRICPGDKAQAEVTISKKKFIARAKYPGTFGNNLQVVVKDFEERHYSNVIIYVVDSSGIRTAVENLTFTVDEQYATDNLLHVDEVESNFIDFIPNTSGISVMDSPTVLPGVMLEGGTDLQHTEGNETAKTFLDAAVQSATARYEAAGYKMDSSKPAFIQTLEELARGLESKAQGQKPIDKLTAQIIAYREAIYTALWYGLDILKDKLAYNHNRIMLSGWDDQDFLFITDEYKKRFTELSPLHIKMLDVAYNSRCATGIIDIPRSLARSGVYNESEKSEEEGYAQKLSRYMPDTASMDINGSLYSSHCALFAPWGQYRYVSTTRNFIAPPSFLGLMIQRAMIQNQSIQYEWALPNSRKHTLNIGKMDYLVPKKLLDDWQKLDGVGVNVITTIPDIGTALWGNSTLFEVPPATYQALANLSTRYLVNAVEDVVWRCGIAITFRYNNEESYQSFYAGVSPLLDTMKSVGAIEDYYIKMAADINGLDQVNANSVVGQIVLIIRGVVNDISVDLIALPQGATLDNYQ